MIRSIAIILGDNDFGATFRNLLDTIRNVLINDPDIPEDVMQKIIRHGIKFHYIAFQNPYEYKFSEKTFEDEFNRTEQYLSSIDIYFNEIAEKKFETEDHDAGAWFLQVNSGTITSF